MPANCISRCSDGLRQNIPAHSCSAVSVYQVSVLIRAGAALDSQIAGGRSRPSSNWMCAGSTALHLACARGLPSVAAILLDAQAADPGEQQLPIPTDGLPRSARRQSLPLE